MTGMLDRTITVKYVNPARAKSKRRTIKDTDGNLYGVWPDKIDMFQPGHSYDVELQEVPLDDGTMLVNITDAIMLAAPTAKPPPPPPPPPGRRGANDNGHSRSLPIDDAERIFVCAALKSCMRPGEVPDEDEVVEAITVLRNAWRRTFGAK